MKLRLDPRSKKKDGTIPLVISIHHKRTITINLGIDLKKDQWDGEKIINHTRKKFYNSIIKQKSIEVEAFYLKLKNEGKLNQFTPSQLKRAIENLNSDKPEESNLFLFKDHYNKYISEITNKRTKEIYSATYNKISNFTNIDTLQFSEITYSWLKEFEIFMSEKTPTINARSIHLRNIRAIFNHAIDDDEAPVTLNDYPFRRFKIKKQRTIKRSLSIEQLIQIRDKDWGNDRANEVADIFMLMFYLIGINIIDLVHLKDINQDRINYTRAKTLRPYDIEVLPEAKEIFEKYPGEDHLLVFRERYTDYKGFTKDMNKRLKDIGIEIGCPDISTYYARHSWATIAAELEIPKETIAAALGHGGNSVTDIYIDFNQKKIDDANRKVLEYLNKKSLS